MMKIKKNIGLFDQFIRIGISLLLVYVGFIDKSIIDDSFSSMILGIVGSITLIFALLGRCPLYSACGIDTYTQHQED